MTTQYLNASLFACIALTATSSAQIKMPAPSPASEVSQTVGITKFKITYSRPGVKDREIFGDLVPYGALWRTGANAPTKISFDTDINFGGKPVSAGEYVLFSIPGKDKWTVILNGDTDVANTAAYDEKKDVARVVVEPVELKTKVENFSIGFDNLKNDSATLEIDWATLRVQVPIGVDTDKISEASIKEAIKTINSWTAGDYASAATFYADKDRDPAKALEWMGKAVSMNEKAFWWGHSYAKMLAKQGKKAEAIAAAEKSLATAKENPGNGDAYVKMNEQLLSTLR